MRKTTLSTSAATVNLSRPSGTANNAVGSSQIKQPKPTMTVKINKVSNDFILTPNFSQKKTTACVGRGHYQ